MSDEIKLTEKEHENLEEYLARAFTKVPPELLTEYKILEAQGAKPRLVLNDDDTWKLVTESQ